MKIFALKLIISILTFYNSYSFDFPFSDESSNSTILQELINSLMTQVMENAVKMNISSGLTRECQGAIDRTFLILNKTDYTPDELNLSYYYYSKLLFDSSTNVNDLSSYQNCMQKNHQYDFNNTFRKPLTSAYLTVFLDYRKDLFTLFKKETSNTTFLIGICFIENCTQTDHKILIKRIMDEVGLTNKNERLGKNFYVYSLKTQDYKPDILTLFKLIPAIYIFIHIFIVLFHKFIEYLYKKIKDTCCDKHKSVKIVPRIKVSGPTDDRSSNNSFSKKNDKQKKQHQTFKNYMKALFNIEKNFDFLINIENENEINSDTSLSYMNGIKGISMITLLFGFVYLDLYNAPVTKINGDNFYMNMSSPLFCIYYFGLKYAPKLLLCSSGFSLFYKFICFLDSKAQAEKDLKNVKEEQMNKSGENSNINLKNESSMSNSSCNDSKSSRHSTKREKFKVPSKYYFLFIASQLHKYILYLLVLLFILYSIYDVNLLFNDIGPMWKFFHDLMIEPSRSWNNLVPSLFCLPGFFLTTEERDIILNYFYLVYQEVVYFIISSLIIFLGYKYNIRIDRFLVITMVLLFIIRLIIYYALNDGQLNIKEYFSFNTFGFFYNSLIYNYLYYAIGIYFGSLNYVLQKGYTYFECDKQRKVYLLGFTRLVKIIKKKSKLVFYYLGIAFLILIIIFSFGQPLLFKYVKVLNGLNDHDFRKIPDIISEYDQDLLISSFMMIDTDIVVLLVNLMALFFYLKGENYVIKFLDFHFWRIFNKIYFSFILLIHPVILYVFFITETRITFNLENCTLYSLACGIILFSLTILVYIIFELPYKKVIKLILKRSEINVGDERFDIMENSDINKEEIKGNLVSRNYSVDTDNDMAGEEDEREENNYIQLDEKKNFVNENDNENE